ncbi:MAG: DNA polymerase IV [Acidobacteriota bacterium]|jgi:DNA polymerase-4|nr:DNA polymerase IV [Acidobacteriota bacterium]NLT33124.1 DNA polymerase IV [Acidobacteriota bacterium]
MILDREIIYLAVRSFPVAVERVVHPELRRRPVVVAPRSAARSVVTALSPEAWRAGVRKGMPLARALRCCRDTIVLPPNEPLYLRASRAICGVLAAYSPVLEPSGYGHAYLDVTGTGRLWGPPRDAAWKARREIRRRLGLEAALGIASNKMVSRIASEVTRTAGLQDVPHGDEASFLSPLPVGLLPGVGPRTGERFRELNLSVIRDVAAMRPEHLALAFGRFGFLLRERALGIDRTPVVPARSVPALELEKALGEDSNDYGLLARELAGLCARAGERLRAEGRRAGRVEVRVRYADYGEGVGRAGMAVPLESSAALYGAALPLLRRALGRRTRVRSMRLRLEALSAGPVQMDLFADPGAARRLKLEQALDALGRRYGRPVLLPASLSAGA